MCKAFDMVSHEKIMFGLSTHIYQLKQNNGRRGGTLQLVRETDSLQSTVTLTVELVGFILFDRFCSGLNAKLVFRCEATNNDLK